MAVNKPEPEQLGKLQVIATLAIIWIGLSLTLTFLLCLIFWVLYDGDVQRHTYAANFFAAVVWLGILVLIPLFMRRHIYKKVNQRRFIKRNRNRKVFARKRKQY